MRLRTVRYLKAFALFEQKKYDESMDLFSSVSATPRMVISLFPPQIAGDVSQHEDPDDSESKPTDQAENGTSSPVIASAVPEGLRASLDSTRKSKDGESDTSSILSKHTEISSSGPPGITTTRTGNRSLTCRGKRFNSCYVGVNSISSRHAIQTIPLVKHRSIRQSRLIQQQHRHKNPFLPLNRSIHVMQTTTCWSPSPQTKSLYPERCPRNAPTSSCTTPSSP